MANNISSSNAQSEAAKAVASALGTQAASTPAAISSPKKKAAGSKKESASVKYEYVTNIYVSIPVMDASGAVSNVVKCLPFHNPSVLTDKLEYNKPTDQKDAHGKTIWVLDKDRSNAMTKAVNQLVGDDIARAIKLFGAGNVVDQTCTLNCSDLLKLVLHIMKKYNVPQSEIQSLLGLSVAQLYVLRNITVSSKIRTPKSDNLDSIKSFKLDSFSEMKDKIDADISDALNIKESAE